MRHPNAAARAAAAAEEAQQIAWEASFLRQRAPAGPSSRKRKLRVLVLDGHAGPMMEAAQ